MKKILLVSLFLFSFAHRDGRDYPVSIQPGRFSLITGLGYNMEGGLRVEAGEGVDESAVFRQTYNWDTLLVWSIKEPSPTLNAADRKVAYKYYSEIPGVVWIEKTLFCDETEIANIYWQEYLNATGKTNQREYQSKHLKSLGYFTSSQFYFFPAVEISYEEALDFCEWRTKVLTKIYNHKHGHREDSKDYTVFEFRLPTKQEWIKCASFGLDTVLHHHIYKDSLISTIIYEGSVQFMQSLGSTINSLKAVNFNAKIKKDYAIHCKRFYNPELNLHTPFYVWSHPSNLFGIFNMLGNVSEMTATKGLAKGGSFKDTYSDCSINKEFNYTQPEDHLGFRCVCEIKWPNRSQK